MNLKKFAITIAVVLGIVLASQLPLSAQEPPKHHHYKLIDVGTFGGPAGYISQPSSPALNNRGMLVGISDTAASDPFSPNCFLDCYLDQSWVLQNGVVTPLSPLPGGASTFAAAINARGQIAGISQNGAVDPSTGWPETDAVLWQDGDVTNLETLGGSQSIANDVNDEGQAVGAALNGISDPFAGNQLLSCVLFPPVGCYTYTETFLFSAPATTQTHAFVWTKAQGMQDLGTLGGPDSAAWIINDRGQIAGESFTSFTANPSSGVPTIDPFFWDPNERKMIDLGGLGGTFGAPVFINGRGQVVGVSNPPGDTTEHPFIWSRSEGLRDLGTLGGTFGHPDSINDAGEVVGYATTLGDQAGHAFLWRNGKMTDLGTLGTDPQSESVSINSQGQVAGETFTDDGIDLRGFLWENGGSPVDLNTLIVPGSITYVAAALLINDGGDIACRGFDPGDTEEHACLLIPCDENHPGIEGCDYGLVDATTATQSPAPRYVPSGMQRSSQWRRTNRYHLPGLDAPVR